jgi:hypothetical protein
MRRSTILRFRAASVLFLLGCAPLLGSCATVFAPDTQFDFAHTQRKYTQMVRWAQFERAADFVDPEVIPEYRAQAAAMSSVRFTDYQIREVGPEEDGRILAKVTYFAYLRSQPVAVAFDEEQEWSQSVGRWVVRSSFAQRPLLPGENDL